MIAETGFATKSKVFCHLGQMVAAFEEQMILAAQMVAVQIAVFRLNFDEAVANSEERTSLHEMVDFEASEPV